MMGREFFVRAAGAGALLVTIEVALALRPASAGPIPRSRLLCQPRPSDCGPERTLCRIPAQHDRARLCARVKPHHRAAWRPGDASPIFSVPRTSRGFPTPLDATAFLGRGHPHGHARAASAHRMTRGPSVPCRADSNQHNHRQWGRGICPPTRQMVHHWESRSSPRRCGRWRCASFPS